MLIDMAGCASIHTSVDRFSFYGNTERKVFEPVQVGIQRTYICQLGSIIASAILFIIHISTSKVSGRFTSQANINRQDKVLLDNLMVYISLLILHPSPPNIKEYCVLHFRF